MLSKLQLTPNSLIIGIKASISIWNQAVTITGGFYQVIGLKTLKKKIKCLL